MIQRFAILALFLSITMAVAPPDDQWTDSHDGKTVTLGAGQAASLTLIMAAGTGYRWELAPVDGNIMTVTGPDIDAGSDPALMGGPVAMRWTVQAKSKGEAEIKARLLRPWQPEQPAKTVTIRVIIKE